MRVLTGEDYNPVTGLTTRYFTDHDSSGNPVVIVQRLQDISPLLDQNRTELNSRSSKRGVQARDGHGLGTKVASIPFGVVDEIRQEYGLDLMTCSDAELRRFLNSPENTALRTAHGRL